jgi:hypothetical protein
LRNATTPRLLLVALALWLAFWPATSAATRVVPYDAPAMATGAAGDGCADGCCQAVPAATRTGCGGARPSAGDADAPAPCRDRCGDPAAVPTCPAGKTARCAACFGSGGVVLFVTACPELGVDRTLVGIVPPCCQICSSRHLQPPVPPPWPVV